MAKIGDIFLVEYKNYYGHQKHYFYCVYSQEMDINNILTNDVVGLLITTNRKMEKIIKNDNDYNVKIKLYTQNAYVCCDKQMRFNKKEIKDVKGDLLDDREKAEILFYYKRFIKESLRQLGEQNERI